MRVICLKNDQNVYSCNSYLVRGDWNRIEDMNTLIDAGATRVLTEEIKRIPTGFGKQPLDQILLTHNHSDHTAGLMEIKNKYNPAVYAYAKFEGVDRLLNDGQMILIADREFEVIHAPGHSSDSVCFYCAKEKVLFSGDTTLHIMSLGGSYEEAFIAVLDRLAGLDIKTIFSGHDDPITSFASDMIRNTLENVRKSTIKEKEGLILETISQKMDTAHKISIKEE
jgi:glyoxylase-like metal-dependent hydrolase (beta-lactamase superfamily II)